MTPIIELLATTFISLVAYTSTVHHPSIHSSISIPSLSTPFRHTKTLHPSAIEYTCPEPASKIFDTIRFVLCHHQINKQRRRRRRRIDDGNVYTICAKCARVWLRLVYTRQQLNRKIVRVRCVFYLRWFRSECVCGNVWLKVRSIIITLNVVVVVVCVWAWLTVSELRKQMCRLFAYADVYLSHRAIATQTHMHTNPYFPISIHTQTPPTCDGLPVVYMLTDEHLAHSLQLTMHIIGMWESQDIYGVVEYKYIYTTHILGVSLVCLLDRVELWGEERWTISKWGYRWEICCTHNLHLVKGSERKHW